MKYQIQVPQIHCSGCINLIRLTLEEQFLNVEVVQASKIVIFESNHSLEDMRKILDRTFETELKPSGYNYSELIQLNI